MAEWPAKLRYPGQESVEGTALTEMRDLRQGVPIYAAASPDRFSSAIYGPLYYLLGAQLIDPQKPSYLPLRLVSLLGTLGCASGCALLAFWLTGRRLAAATAPLIFFAYGFVTFHGLSGRSDLAALFLSFGGFLVAYRFRASRALLLAVPLMLLGFYYKQQFVAGCLAVFLFLVLEKRYRLAGTFVTVLAFGGLAALVLFEYVVFRGQAFLLHLTTYNLVLFSWNRFVFGALLFVIIFGVPLLLGFEFLRRHPNRLLSCYLGSSILVTVVALAKEGSGTNYFLECVVVFSALAAALLSEEIERGSDAVAVIFLLAVAALAGQRLGAFAPAPEDFAKDRAVHDFLSSNFPPGTPALGDFTADLMRAGLATPISDLFQYSWLICRGTVSDRDLLAQLQNRRFGVLMLTADLRDERYAHPSNNICLTEPLHRAILQNYRLFAVLEAPGPEKTDAADLHLYCWVPRDKSESVSSMAVTDPRPRSEAPDARGARRERVRRPTP